MNIIEYDIFGLSPRVPPPHFLQCARLWVQGEASWAALEGELRTWAGFVWVLSELLLVS